MPRETGDRLQLVLPDGRWAGMPEAGGLASRLAAGLAGEGAIVNLCEDRLSFLAVLMAAALAGRTSLIPSDRSPRGLRSVGRLYPKARAFADEGDIAQQARAAGIDAETVRFEPGDSAAVADLDPTAFDDAEIVMFTSGSTGQPAPCGRPMSFFRHGARGNAACMTDGLRRPVGIVATPPPFHMFGFELSVAVPLFEGGTVHSGRPFYPADIARALEEVPAPRILVSTPAHLRVLAESGIAIPHVERVFSATAPLSAELARSVEAMTGGDLREIFGTTETGSIGWRHTARETSFHLLHGLELTTEQSACMIAGPHIQPPRRLPDDLRVIGIGKFSIGARSDDIVNIAGKRMSLAGMNAILTGLAGVRDGAFLPPPDDVAGPVKRTVAFVVAPDLNAGEIRALLRDRLDAAFLPRRILQVDALPRNETGKLPLDALRRFAFAALVRSDVSERTVHFGPDEPFFQGHFPGHPIVPGAVLLAEAAELLAEVSAAMGAPMDVVSARFPASAVPGVDCLFRVAGSTGGQVRIECEQAGRIVMKAAMRPAGMADE